jgi:hypothetical protein
MMAIHAFHSRIFKLLFKKKLPDMVAAALTLAFCGDGSVNGGAHRQGDHEES